VIAFGAKASGSLDALENIKSAKLICPRGDTPFGGTFLPDWKPGQILPFLTI
jgi:hypothetical protein